MRPVVVLCVLTACTGEYDVNDKLNGVTAPSNTNPSTQTATGTGTGSGTATGGTSISTTDTGWVWTTPTTGTGTGGTSTSTGTSTGGTTGTGTTSSGTGTGTGTGTLPPHTGLWDTGVWDLCDWADQIAGFLDGYNLAGDNKVVYCHATGGGNFNMVDSSVNSCLTHISHVDDIFPSTLCDS